MKEPRQRLAIPTSDPGPSSHAGDGQDAVVLPLRSPRRSLGQDQTGGPRVEAFHLLEIAPPDAQPDDTDALLDALLGGALSFVLGVPGSSDDFRSGDPDTEEILVG